MRVVRQWLEKIMLNRPFVSDARLKDSNDDCVLSCLRFLRILFSAPRNRTFLSEVFNDDILDSFVAIGNYVHDFSSYRNFYQLLQNSNVSVFSPIFHNHGGPIYK